MADIKTNLRELSVLVGVFFEVNNVASDMRYNLGLIKETIKNEIFYGADIHISNVMSLTQLTPIEKGIILNGFTLAKEITDCFSVETIKSLKWYGYDSQKKDPVDIEINDLNFSLKEDSFILENMGLYKLVNLLTGSNHKRLHIFKDYALTEYNTWFDTTWKILVDYLNTNSSWKLTKGKKMSEIFLTTNYRVRMTFSNGQTIVTKDFSLSTSLSDFESNSSGVIREKVFSKFINYVVSNNPKYLIDKQKCAVKAGNNLVNHLNSNLNYTKGLKRFLRIHDESYYYAKTTAEGVDILYVPSSEEFANELQIKSIESSVPNSQVNIITTILNKKTGKTLTLRNECRFSHGQFNGTPEAKMYYDRGSNLLTIYRQID